MTAYPGASAPPATRPPLVSETAPYSIIQGDALQTLKTLPSGIVQTCVTSPPYYGLRAYLDHDDPNKPLEIGLEETPDCYVARLVEVFGEVRRVLRDDGLLWLNLGDSYNGSGGAGGDYSPGGLKEGQPKYPGRNVANLGPKQILGIPWRVAFALQADGWILRSDIIWAKPNPMPESVSDRPTKSHEYIFLLSKSREYFYDSEAIAERSVRSGDIPGAGGAFTIHKSFTQHQTPVASTRNKRSVWTISTRPYANAHFATFPEALVEPMILAGSSAYGACAKCGSPWARVVERETTPHMNGKSSRVPGDNRPLRGSLPAHLRTDPGRSGFGTPSSTTLGWAATCTCNADVVPCTVLDPFSGASTTGLVALKHGRKYIGLELNPDYIEMSHKRLLGVASQRSLFALDIQAGGG